MDNLFEILDPSLSLDSSGIYSFKDIGTSVSSQQSEYDFRKSVASSPSLDVIKEIKSNYSIAIRQELLNYFLEDLPTNSLILDLGCGYSWQWNLTLPKSYRIILVDFVYENLIVAKKVLADNTHHEFIYVHAASSSSLPFADKVFDLVWLAQVFQHMPNPETDLSNIQQKMKPMSKLISTDFNYRNVERFIKRMFGFSYLNESQTKNFYIRRVSYKSDYPFNIVFGDSSDILFSEHLFQPYFKKFHVLYQALSILDRLFFHLQWPNSLARQISKLYINNQ